MSQSTMQITESELKACAGRAESQNRAKANALALAMAAKIVFPPEQPDTA